ncbi:MAG: helix-turn-helix domain-containing protein [Phycisphaerae bacterium]
MLLETTPDILTVAEVAAFMRVSRETVYRMAGRGELPGRKIGRIWRFSRDGIRRFVHQQSAE